MECYGRHTSHEGQRSDICSCCEIQEQERCEIKCFLGVHNYILIYTGPPTQKQAYQALLQKEIEDVLAGTGTGGCTQFINDGLQLERDQ